MKPYGIVAVLGVLGFIYIYWVRPYLKTLPSLKQLWDKEDSLWAAFKIWLDGRKTVWTGILGTLMAIGPDIIDQTIGIDLKTLFHLPDAWAAWVTQVTTVLMIIFRIRAKIGGE